MNSIKEKRKENIDKIFSNNETAQVRGTTSERVKSVRNRFGLTQKILQRKLKYLLMQ